MASRRALLLAVATLILCPLGAGAEAAVPTPFYGVVPQSHPSVEDFDRMAEAGVGTLRFMISWADADRTADAGDLGWAASDWLVREAAPHPLNRGVAGQANRLTRALGFFRKNRNKLNLRGVSWYS